MVSADWATLKFANAWGCEVTAFTSNESKADEAKSFGAHRVAASRDSSEILKAANSLDFLLIGQHPSGLVRAGENAQAERPHGYRGRRARTDGDLGHRPDLRAKTRGRVVERRTCRNLRDAGFRRAPQHPAAGRTFSDEQAE